MTNRYEAHLTEKHAWKIFDHFTNQGKGKWVLSCVWQSHTLYNTGVELWFEPNEREDTTVFYRKWN